MRILQGGTPFYPDRPDINFSNATMTDDTVNECTTVNLAAPTSLAIPAPGSVNVGDATVAQATNVNTAVTINGASGVITTQSASTAAVSAEVGFTVTNSAVASTSVVLARVVAYSGTYHTNGQPDCEVTAVSGGSFNIRIVNRDTANALSGTMKLHFLVC
jgi:hypothetical protein